MWSFSPVIADLAETNSILVLGAGELGLPVLEHMIKHSKRKTATVSVMLRTTTIESQDAMKKRANDHLKTLGIVLVPGDAVSNSITELAAIFQNRHTVISCTGFGLPPGTQLKLTRAVLDACVSRYFPWQFGVDYDAIGTGSGQDLFDEQLEVRVMLRAQKQMDWTIVSTGIFMSFLFQVPAFGPVDIENGVLRAQGSWDSSLSVTTPEDIGRMVAEIVYYPRAMSMEPVYIAGDTVTYARAAELIEYHYPEKHFLRDLWSADDLSKQLSDSPRDVMVKYRNAFAGGRGVAWDMIATVNKQRGILLEDAANLWQRWPSASD